MLSSLHWQPDRFLCRPTFVWYAAADQVLCALLLWILLGQSCWLLLDQEDGPYRHGLPPAGVRPNVWLALHLPGPVPAALHLRLERDLVIWLLVLPSLVLLDLVGGVPRGVRICVPPVRRVCTVLVRMYVLLDTEVSDSCTIHTLGSPVHHTGIRTARFLENVSNRYGLVGADILGRWCELLMPLVSRHLC